MNYFAHACPFLDDPYFLAGTGVPDWLTVVDRAVRVRPKHAQSWADAPDARVAAVARGLTQHFRDDARFHAPRAFAEVNLALGALVRPAVQGEAGFRPWFLAHLLVELLLDATLIAAAPQRLEKYYALLQSVDAQAVQAAVNQMTPHPTERLAPMIVHFAGERVLSDYADDRRMMTRLDQIMQRVGFPRLPAGFIGILPEARRLVAGRAADLLEGIPVPAPDVASEEKGAGSSAAHHPAGRSGQWAPSPFPCLSPFPG
jgi:hypothetical protein